MNHFELYDKTAEHCSKAVTLNYSTSFAIAINLLGPDIRNAIHSIYGFVRLADEIVDTFHAYPKAALLEKFESDTYEAIRERISLNPILHNFQSTVHRYRIGEELLSSFLQSMKQDLNKKNYDTNEYKEYIFGSADVVGLMCLKVFVNGDEREYESLKDSAMRLGSAFQKVNFLRDIKHDLGELDRSYFPGVDFHNFSQEDKARIVLEIENDFRLAYEGIRQLPAQARLGVLTAYHYYRQLLKNLKAIPAGEIMRRRIRVPNFRKLTLLAYSYLYCKTKLA